MVAVEIGHRLAALRRRPFQSVALDRSDQRRRQRLVYDTRNDTTGARYETDIYLSRSSDGGATYASNVRASDVSSNEHDCDGVFPCAGINYGNQQGDYAGLASYGGVSHAIWTDSRLQLSPSSGCRTNLVMEEVFTAVIDNRKGK